jgi:hypothetical protein
MRNGVDEVYKLWQPGIVIGVGSTNDPPQLMADHHFSVYHVMRSFGELGELSKLKRPCPHFSWSNNDPNYHCTTNLFDAFSYTPAYALIVASVARWDKGFRLPIQIRDDFGLPYRWMDMNSWYYREPSRPATYTKEAIEQFADQGKLRKYKSFCTLNEFLELECNARKIS